MANVIRHLRIDHVHMNRLLDVLEAQLALFHEGENPDYTMMMDIMQYMVNYPDRFHHPKEDLVFKKLAERDPGARLVVKDLMNKHEALSVQGNAFIESLRTVLSEFMVERKTLESQGYEYTKTLRQHIDIEENQVLPLAAKLLLEQDWNEIEDTMEAIEDPLFGPTIEKEYLALYDYIKHQSE
jgi:hemerythrin-like domain-containing protein